MAYASLSDVQNLGVPAQAIAQVSPAQSSAILQSASEEADGYFRARWGSGAVPLVAWDAAVTDAVAKIAAYRILRVRGYASNAGADTEFRRGYDDALEWLMKVQRQQAHPLVTLRAEDQPGSQQPKLRSSSVVDLSTGATSARRGW